MEDIYSQSYEEVYEIINIMPIELSRKIPIRFKQMLEKNKSKIYKANITSIEEVNESNLKPETIALLALIYRDYLCSEEKREELIKEKLSIKEQEELYDINNIFKHTKKKYPETANTEQGKNISKNLIEIKKKSFIIRMIEKIKNFFTK